MCAAKLQCVKIGAQYIKGLKGQGPQIDQGIPVLQSAVFNTKSIPLAATLGRQSAKSSHVHSRSTGCKYALQFHPRIFELRAALIETEPSNPDSVSGNWANISYGLSDNLIAIDQEYICLNLTLPLQIQPLLHTFLHQHGSHEYLLVLYDIEMRYIFQIALSVTHVRGDSSTLTAVSL